MGALTADTEPMVQAALTRLGRPYVLGATGPEQFDCSGLVQWSAKQAGFSTTRTTYTQIFEGDPVQGAPQRGDLVFPDVGHVGIALGGDQMIHAPEPGDVVKIGTYWTTPVAIRRLGPNTGLPSSTTVDPRYAAGGGVDLASYLPGSGAIQAQLSNLNSAVANQVGILGGFGDIFNAIGDFLTLMMSREGWIRILKVAGGMVSVAIGIAFIAIEFVGRMM